MSTMTRRRKALVALSALGLVVVAALAAWIMPMIFGPAVPAGATRLSITTEAPGLTLGCPAALLAPVRVSTDGDALVLVNVDFGELVPVVWPAGFGAWRQDGRAAVVEPWGGIIGREGDVLDQLGGGLGAGDVFHICPLGLVPRTSPANAGALPGAGHS